MTFPSPGVGSNVPKNLMGAHMPDESGQDIPAGPPLYPGDFIARNLGGAVRVARLEDLSRLAIGRGPQSRRRIVRAWVPVNPGMIFGGKLAMSQKAT